jgi:aerobic-type carbon monoxide dehydrogenase small subunit (CoxS/CutS family)
MISLDVNGRRHDVDVSPDMPLLWVLRDTIGLTGTKFGCGLGQCGACTVHVDGQPARSCVTPVSVVSGAKVVTLAGLGTPDKPHPIQKAYVEEQVPQCGYCINGWITARRSSKETAVDAEIRGAHRAQMPLRHLHGHPARSSAHPR